MFVLRVGSDFQAPDLLPGEQREPFTFYDVVTLGATSLTGALTLSGAGSIDAGGKILANHISSVVTSVTGALTITAHGGNICVTSGNVTVPTSTGFGCMLIFGGAHAITFNGTVSAAMATGDIVSLVVQSGAVIKAVKVAAADLVAFT